MDQDDTARIITELEREIALLPEGSVTKKRIKGRDYFYHRINKNGKRTETFISFDELEDFRNQIGKRKFLEARLKEYAKRISTVMPSVVDTTLHFNTMVRIGKQLKSQVSTVRNYKKRECFNQLSNYIYGDADDKVFVLYGLRRTGKTTMVRQIIDEMSDEDFGKTAFIQITTRDTLADLNEDLRVLEDSGYRYVFIDEVTLLEDFIDSSAIFADIYASSGMKIVLSGTDSLGFAITNGEQLYDRCIMLHTTFIPYREFEEVLGIGGIDEYIRYGGTMSLGGVNYNEKATFANAKSAEEYINSAIAKNIQHSLNLYEHGGHFRGLLDLHERNELTNVINRVIENINHRFTRSVVEASSLVADAGAVFEQSIAVDETHLAQIKEYLEMLDLIVEIDLESLPGASTSSLTVISQPGLRYAQAEVIVDNLLKDAKFNELSAKERQAILLRLLNEIRGRMMEEIVLLETKLANPHKRVFKLQFAVGEFDMVVLDPKELTCDIFEIKHSKEQAGEQYRHLIDERKCDLVTHNYGDILNRYVIYRGEDDTVDGIHYLNVEKYLKALG